MKALVLATALAANLVSVAHADQNPFVSQENVCMSGAVVVAGSAGSLLVTLVSTLAATSNYTSMVAEDARFRSNIIRIREINSDIEDLGPAHEDAYEKNNSERIQFIEDEVKKLTDEKNGMLSNMLHTGLTEVRINEIGVATLLDEGSKIQADALSKVKTRARFAAGSAAGLVIGGAIVLLDSQISKVLSSVATGTDYAKLPDETRKNFETAVELSADCTYTKK